MLLTELYRMLELVCPRNIQEREEGKELFYYCSEYYTIRLFGFSHQKRSVESLRRKIQQDR